MIATFDCNGEQCKKLKTAAITVLAICLAPIAKILGDWVGVLDEEPVKDEAKAPERVS